MIKLLMSWDIKQGQEADYFEFVVKEFVPGMMKMGLQPADTWYTLYGKGPQILTGGTADNLETMRHILETKEWQQLMERLGAHVTNYRQKIVRSAGRFQL